MRYADLPRGFVIAHRGGALQVPENTLEGHRVAVQRGLTVLEQDVQVLADGELGVMHDGTVDRTTTSSGNVADHTAASWKRLRIDAGSYFGGTWGDDLHPPLFGEILAEFGGRVLLCPEAKSPGTMTPMLDALERSGTSRETVLVQSFSHPECLIAVARGWQALWLGSTDPVRAAGDGIGWIGVEAPAVTPDLCRSAHAVGVEVACYTVNRVWLWQRLRACGVDACFSDDPVYLRDGGGSRRRDLFAEGDWAPGMQADHDARGRFHPDGSFGFDAGGTESWALVGYLGPTDPAAFTLDLAMCFDGDGDGDGEGAGSVFLSTTDRPFTGAAAPGVDGYLFVLHRSGQLVLQRVRDGVETTLGRTQATVAPQPGEYVPLSVTVTPTGISFARRDGGDAVRAAGPGGWELGVVHIGRRRAAVRVRDVVFS